MSYQPRLDRLESEVFNTSSPSVKTNYTYFLPYVLIFVVTLISLYSFCPDSLRIKRQRQYHLRTERFTAVWLLLAVTLSIFYYKFLSEKRAD
jgi:hypothetical protein